MTGTPRDWQEMASRAAALPDDRFLKVVQLFERIRTDPGVAEAMSVMRPRMATLRPPRRLTVDRAFFQPVEDLLDDAGMYRRRQSRISRAVLPACWRIVAGELPSGMINGVQTALAEVDRLNARTLLSITAPLWVAGGEVLRAAVAHAQKDLKVRNRLFGRDEDVLRQAGLVAELACIGPSVERLKAALPPPPIVQFGDYHLDALRSELAALAPNGGKSLLPLLLVLTVRMLRPGDLIPIIADMPLPGTREDGVGLVREVGAAALDTLLGWSAEFAESDHGAVAAGKVAETAERLIEGLDSLQRQIAPGERQKLAPQMEAVRSAVGQSIRQAVIAPAGEALLAPARSMTVALRGRNPVVTADREKSRQAEEFALAFRRAMRIAGPVGLKAEMEQKVGEVCLEARRLTESLATGATDRAGRWRTPPERVDEQIVTMLRLVELIAGPDEADAILTTWEERLASSPHGR